MLRFGRKIAVPSTNEIKHELRLLNGADALIAEARTALKGVALSAKQSTELIGLLGRKHGISAGSAQALVDLIGKPSCLPIAQKTA